MRASWPALALLVALPSLAAGPAVAGVCVDLQVSTDPGDLTDTVRAEPDCSTIDKGAHVEVCLAEVGDLEPCYIVECSIDSDVACVYQEAMAGCTDPGVAVVPPTVYDDGENTYVTEPEARVTCDPTALGDPLSWIE